MIQIILGNASTNHYTLQTIDIMPHIKPLALFLEEAFGSLNLEDGVTCLNDDTQEGWYDASEHSTVYKADEHVFIKSEYGEPNAATFMPKEKFIIFLKKISEYAYLATEQYRPQQIFFTFDDEWNCTITWSNL